MEILNNNLPLVPSGIFQKGIVFPSTPDDRLSHFHISTSHFIYTFSFPKLDLLNVVECRRDCKILAIQRFLKHFLLVVYADATVELRSIDNLDHVERSWSKKDEFNIRISFVDLKIVNNSTLVVHGVGSSRTKPLWHLYYFQVDLMKESKSLPVKRLLTTKNDIDPKNFINGIAVNKDATVVSVLTRPYTFFVNLDKSDESLRLMSVDKVSNNEDASSIAYIEDLDTFAVGYKHGTISLFASDGTTTTAQYHSGRIGHISLIQNQYLVTCSVDGYIAICKVEKIGFRPKKINIGFSLEHATSTPNNEYMIVVSASNKISVFEVNTYKAITKSTTQAIGEYQGPAVPINFSNFGIVSPIGKNDRIAFIGNSNIQIYNVKEGHQMQFIELHDQVPDINTFAKAHAKINVMKLKTTHIAFTRTGKFMASAEHMGGLSNIKIWKHLATGYKLLSFIDTPHEGPVSQMIFTLDASKLISLGKDKTIKVWDLISNKIICNKVITLQGKTPYRAAISPDGTVMVVAFKSRIAFYDTSSFELLRYIVINGKKCTEIGFLTDSKVIVHYSDFIQAIHLKNLTPMWKFSFPNEIVKIAVNPHRENEFAMITVNVTYNNSRIYLVDTRKKTPRAISYSMPASAVSLTYLDEHHFAVQTTDMIIKIYSTSMNRDEEDVERDSTFDKLDAVISRQKKEDAASYKAETSNTINKMSRENSTLIRDSSTEKEHTDLFSVPGESMNRYSVNALQRYSFDPSRGKELWRSLLDAPSHALPSCMDIFSTFVDGYLLRKDSQIETFDKNRLEKNNDAMEDVIPAHYASGLTTQTTLTNSNVFDPMNQDKLQEFDLQPVYVMRNGRPVLVDQPSDHLKEKQIDEETLEKRLIQALKASQHD